MEVAIKSGAKKISPIHPGEIPRDEFLSPFGVTAAVLARKIKVPNLFKKLCIFFVFFNFNNSFASIKDDDCIKFHTGIFSYEGKLGTVVIKRTKSEEITYRVFPTDYIRSSIKWISACVAERKTLEVNDQIFSDEIKSKVMQNIDKIYITEIFPDGYSYKFKDNKSKDFRYMRVKIHRM